MATSTTRAMRRSGFGVENGATAPWRRRCSPLASALWPTSACGHHVDGTSPLASARNTLRRGTLSPSAPNQITPSSRSCAKRVAVTRQHEPAGGSTTRPEGNVSAKNWSLVPWPPWATSETVDHGPRGSASGLRQVPSASRRARRLRWWRQSAPAGAYTWR